ncbi:MAG: FAD-dependent oxidoreductase [Campylobacterota bacterium]|nr:FAD-dependent oxidoreductase [Campylobacterota bacterium]
MVDVLVIGAGGAGLVAALHAKASGASVKVISKSYPTRSQTCMAQGGINAALSHADIDNVDIHIEDTLKSSQGLASIEAIEMLCREGVEAVQWLDRIGVPFSRTEDSEIAQRRLGGATHARACYAQDYTGLKILHTLYDQCNKEGIIFYNERYLLNLISEDNYVGGATALNIKTGEIESYRAKSVILATGGYSRIYGKHSTNATGSTGDGIAAAIRAGAKLSDMEFVQFHPTALKNSSILISESARGAGGYLLNKKGERFTDELAPRDKLSQAILEEIENATGEVFLDIRHLGEHFIDEELPQERKLAKLYENIDPVHDIIPIKPVAHYTMGGIAVDNTSQTALKGLFAVGECANHNVHGANRLGGNSLLELIVFGKQAGCNASQYAQNSKLTCKDTSQLEDDKNYISKLYKSSNTIDFYEQRAKMGDIFYQYAGIKRNEKDLTRVLDAMHKMQLDLALMGPKDSSKIYNTDLMEFIEFSNMVQLAEIVVHCAINRSESRGAHFRSDAPEKVDEHFKTHTIIYQKEGMLMTQFSVKGE